MFCKNVNGKCQTTIVLSILLCSTATALAQEPVGEDFTIGVYYTMSSVARTDNFDTDYGFMDIARHGVDFVIMSGNTYAPHWASLKHWGIKGVTSYSALNFYNSGMTAEQMEAHVKVESKDRDSMMHSGEYVGDALVGYVFIDEPECHDKTEDEINFLRAYADLYHQYNPTREIYVNHCDPPWVDFHEKQATCSVGATIAVNGDRITARIAEAQRLGHDNFALVALPGRLTGWAGANCGNFNYFGFGPCTDEARDWMASRSNYQDVYEMMTAAYTFGAKGFSVFIYNHSGGYAVALVDSNGVDVDERWAGYVAGRWAGFGDAAHDIRSSHGWPSVELFNNTVPFNDCGTYPAGTFTLTATAESSSGTIEKVVFGKTTNGGSDWETIEDVTAPYSAVFSASAGQTVIFRTQSVDTNGKKSIYAANMIYIQ